jgi:hypothetical protein
MPFNVSGCAAEIAVMRAALWLTKRRREPVDSHPCRMCGDATFEADRTGKPFHRACIAKMTARVVEESRPSLDSHDLAERLRRSGPAESDVPGRMEARVNAAAATLFGDRRASW